MTQKRHGVLLTNLGTPDAPTPSAVRRYLAEFLADPRVVEIPRLIWLPILHGIILNTRPRKSAEAYHTIWTESGSPLLNFSQALAQGVGERLAAEGYSAVQVELGMRYGNPCLTKALDALADCHAITVLPLYPQFACATASSTFDVLVEYFRKRRHIPNLTFISDYHQHPLYIGAIAESIKAVRGDGAGRLLLFSFHGLPARSRQLGDPYYDQCQATAAAIAERLGLAPDAWRAVFQSRFGPAEWLKPYCVDTLESLPAEGVTAVDVVCPGFAVDCLETLEEIAITNREVFQAAGGQDYRYIPALNATAANVELVTALVRPRLES